MKTSKDSQQRPIRVVRNFWLRARAGNRRIELGPRGPDGNLDLVLLIREDGCSVRALTVDCVVQPDGKLAVCVSDGADNELGRLVVSR